MLETTLGGPVLEDFAICKSLLQKAYPRVKKGM